MVHSATVPVTEQHFVVVEEAWPPIMWCAMQVCYQCLTSSQPVWLSQGDIHSLMIKNETWLVKRIWLLIQLQSQNLNKKTLCTVQLY